MEISTADEDSTIGGEEGNEDQKESEDVENQPTREPEGKEVKMTIKWRDKSSQKQVRAQSPRLNSGCLK